MNNLNHGSADINGKTFFIKALLLMAKNQKDIYFILNINIFDEQLYLMTTLTIFRKNFNLSNFSQLHDMLNQYPKKGICNIFLPHF